MDQNFSVVIFGKNTVEAVPTSWISGDTCRWPKLHGPNSAKALKKLQEDPTTIPTQSWSLHQCRVKGRYATYEEADAATTHAIENPSAAESSGSRIKPQARKRRGRKPGSKGKGNLDRSPSSSEGSGSSSIDQTLTQANLPQTSFHFGIEPEVTDQPPLGSRCLVPGELTGGTELFELHDDEFLDDLFADENCATLINEGLTNATSEYSIPNPGQVSSSHCVAPSHHLGLPQLNSSLLTGDTTANLGGGTSEIVTNQPASVTTPATISNFAQGEQRESADTEQNQCNSAFQKVVLKKIAVLESNQRQILALLTGLNPPTEPSPDLDFNGIPAHPASTVKQVEELDNYAKDERHQATLVAYLRSIGGRDTDTVIKNILARIFEDSFARNISYTGKGNHVKFEQFKNLNVAIVKSVRASRKTTDDHIRTVIMDWFRYANTRYKLKTKKTSNAPE